MDNLSSKNEKEVDWTKPIQTRGNGPGTSLKARVICDDFKGHDAVGNPVRAVLVVVSESANHDRLFWHNKKGFGSIFKGSPYEIINVPETEENK